jgi:hypothetical protein
MSMKDLVLRRYPQARCVSYMSHYRITNIICNFESMPMDDPTAENQSESDAWRNCARWLGLANPGDNIPSYSLKISHDEELNRHRTGIIEYGWGKSRGAISTLTNMGNLESSIARSGRIKHRWTHRAPV